MALPYLQQIFDIGDYEGDMQLKADIDHQCGILYRSWKYELHSHYLELLEQGFPDHRTTRQRVVISLTGS